MVDQFLLGTDNHELSMQVAAHGHRCTKDMLRTARYLEAVHGENKHESRPRKPAMQARFVNNGPPTPPILNEWFRRFWPKWAISHKGTRKSHAESLLLGQNGCAVWTGDRLNPGRSSSAEGWSRSRGEPAQCFRCKGFRHFTKDCPSDGYYRVGPSGLPIRTLDPSRDSSQDSRPAKDKATTTHTSN